MQITQAPNTADQQLPSQDRSNDCAADRSFVMLNMLEHILKYSDTVDIASMNLLSTAFREKVSLVDAAGSCLFFKIDGIFSSLISWFDPNTNKPLIDNLTAIKSQIKQADAPSLKSFVEPVAPIRIVKLFHKYAAPIRNNLFDALREDPMVFTILEREEIEAEKFAPFQTIFARLKFFENFPKILKICSKIDKSVTDEEKIESINNLFKVYKDNNYPTISLIGSISNEQGRSKRFEIVFGIVVPQFLEGAAKGIDVKSDLRNLVKILQMEAVIENPYYRGEFIIGFSRAISYLVQKIKSYQETEEGITDLVKAASEKAVAISIEEMAAALQQIGSVDLSMPMLDEIPNISNEYYKLTIAVGAYRALNMAMACLTAVHPQSLRGDILGKFFPIFWGQIKSLELFNRDDSEVYKILLDTLEFAIEAVKSLQNQDEKRELLATISETFEYMEFICARISLQKPTLSGFLLGGLRGIKARYP